MGSKTYKRADVLPVATNSEAASPTTLFNLIGRPTNGACRYPQFTLCSRLRFRAYALHELAKISIERL